MNYILFIVSVAIGASASYFQGLVVNKDYTEAEKWLAKTFKNGVNRPSSVLGICYYAKQNYTKAFKWLSGSEIENDTTALACLANCYINNFICRTKQEQ